jgi:multidrug efflux pump subunit AcrA (membrane-fusion protein)
VVDNTALKAQQAAAAATVTAEEDKVAADSAGTTQYTADAAALTAAKAALHSAKLALRNATLRATITGTVTSVNLTVGQQVTPAGGNSSDSSQVVVQSASTFIVNATVDDTEINQVKRGQSVSVTPDGATFPVNGAVTSVSTVPSSQSGVVSFPITVRLAGHPSGVYAGSSATLSITTKKVSNVLEIPTLAITFNGSTATVQVDNGGGTVTRSITVGESYGLETQVLTGLKAGDKVVVKVPTFARVLPGSGSENGGISKSFGGENGFGGGPPTGSFGSGPTFNSGPTNSVGGN